VVRSPGECEVVYGARGGEIRAREKRIKASGRKIRASGPKDKGCTKRILRIDQSVNIQQLLKQFSMLDCKPADTPAQPPAVLLSTSEVDSALLEWTG
jgi:hypothetical protein